ncbi:hypothetical protein [Paenibacillus sp.]|uniref:hypothetical protein n=1 Tax=Paenibacillus sp. TaxID=58172 RepID=UPI002D72FEFC|nr:hypothetical protein [Paenibacillus sp.]HZG58895.1 hypothetical protein [Paenibacillus sp.]
MWKKIATLFFAFTLVFAASAPLVDHADAKRYRSPSRSYTPDAPARTSPRTDNVDNGATNRAGTTPGATTGRAGRGFGGGGLMRGLMLGGLAGLMFGGLLSGLGAFGSILGLLINVLAIYLLFVLVRKAFRAFTNRRRPGGDYR